MYVVEDSEDTVLIMTEPRNLPTNLAIQSFAKLHMDSNPIIL